MPGIDIANWIISLDLEVQFSAEPSNFWMASFALNDAA